MYSALEGEGTFRVLKKETQKQPKKVGDVFEKGKKSFRKVCGHLQPGGGNSAAVEAAGRHFCAVVGKNPPNKEKRVGLSWKISQGKRVLVNTSGRANRLSLAETAPKRKRAENRNSIAVNLGSKI